MSVFNSRVPDYRKRDIQKYIDNNYFDESAFVEKDDDVEDASETCNIKFSDKNVVLRLVVEVFVS